MPKLTCATCIYAKPGIVDAPGQIVGQTDYRMHLIIGPVCTYKGGKTCVAIDLGVETTKKEKGGE